MNVINVKNVSISFGTDKIARICGVTRPTVGNWIKKGMIKSYVTPGKHQRVWPDDLIAFLKTQGISVPQFLKALDRPGILLIEDDPQVSRVIQKILKDILPKITVYVADNGFEAGSKAVQTRPNLIILDVYLPGINGLDVCKFIRKNSELKNVKILAISGRNIEQTRDAILAAGADDFLGKPFTRDELHEKIKTLLPTGLRNK